MSTWDSMFESEKNDWIVENVLNWKHSDSGKYWLVPQRIEGEIKLKEKRSTPRYTTFMELAMEVANKLGIALIPQSDGDGFRWYACDVKTVSYRGNEIAIEEINDSGISIKNPASAICHAAYLSITNKKLSK